VLHAFVDRFIGASTFPVNLDTSATIFANGRLSGERPCEIRVSESGVIDTSSMVHVLDTWGSRGKAQGLDVAWLRTLHDQSLLDVLEVRPGAHGRGRQSR
jgi:hypothetical protein